MNVVYLTEDHLRLLRSGENIDLANANEMGLTIGKPFTPRYGAKPPTGSLGTIYGEERLFAYWLHLPGGVDEVFDTGPVEDQKLDEIISTDGKVRAVEQALTLPLRGANWHIEAGKHDKGERAFVEQALTTPPEEGGMKTPLNTIIGQMTAATFMRRAYFEKVWTTKNGKVVYDDVAYRPPTSCYLARLASDGSFAGFMQWTWKGWEFAQVLIPAAKAFVYVHGQHRNPLHGTSDLDVAAKAYDSKQKLRFLWYVFLETQAAPRTIVNVPGSDVSEADAAAKKVATLKGGGVVGLTEGTTVTTLTSGGQLADELFQRAINYLDSEMMDSVMAGFLGLTGLAGMGRGSYALSQDQSDFFERQRQAVVDEMGACLTQYLIAPMAAYNFPNPSMPKFRFEELGDAGNVDKTIAMLQAMAVAPQVRVPPEFISELIEKAAGYLELDIDKVTAGIKKMAAQQANQQPTPAQPLHNAVNALAHAAATRMPPGPGGNGISGPTAPPVDKGAPLPPTGIGG